MHRLYLSAFRAVRALPAAVPGPCDLAPLRRLAAARALTVLSWLMGRAVLAGFVRDGLGACAECRADQGRDDAFRIFQDVNGELA